MNRLGYCKQPQGTAGTVGALPAVISAASDALSPLGIRHVNMPASPERIWRAISRHGQEGRGEREFAERARRT